MIDNAYSFGASVRGPLHRSKKILNEDAWLRLSGSFGELIVVCDGVGSKPNARIGSKTACLAVKEGVLRWLESDGAPISYLVHLIEVMWRLRLHPIKPESAATTCLFALATKNGSWTMGGLGDGLVMTKSEAGLEIVLGDRAENFSNQTNGLGISRNLNAWSISEFPPTSKERIAVLATDGVSDDLIPERLEGFSQWLVDDFSKLDPYQRWRKLSTELRNWPTPKHLDDKTLAVIHAPAQSPEI